MPIPRPLAFIALASSLVVATACREPTPDGLVDLGPLPTWSMTSEADRTIGSATLANHVWVANFLFTSCPTSCPALAKATQGLQLGLLKWLPEQGPLPVQIVSISVDPVTDTPAALAKYAAKFHADPRIWHFATGDYRSMESLVTDGFLQPIVRNDRASAGMPGHDSPVVRRPTPLDTAHSLRFVVVDGRGHIRAFFDRDDDSLARLDATVRYLVADL